MGFVNHARQHDWDMLVQSIALASSEHQYLRISLRWYEHRPRVPCGPLWSLEARLRRMDVYHIEIQKNKEPHVPPGEATPYAIMTPQVWFPPSIMVVQPGIQLCMSPYSAFVPVRVLFSVSVIGHNAERTSSYRSLLKTDELAVL